ncbi:hypothetical protein CCP4SC76_880003 [Gammaproteobacteria bacterium]
MAVKVILVPLGKFAEQADPQLMLVGELITVPPPEPDLLTDNVLEPDMKVAVVFFATFIVTVQVELAPEQSPLHPVKVAPLAGIAVSVTVVPTA